MNNRYLNFTNIIFTILLFFFSAFNISYASVPDIFINDLNITKIEGNKIEGNFIIWNGEKYYFPGVGYEIQLIKQLPENRIEIIDTFFSNEYFQLSPNEKKVLNFFYEYPINIKSGEYALRIRSLTENGVELGWQDTLLNLKGKGLMINILEEYSKVKSGDSQDFPLNGINVLAGTDVIANMRIENDNDDIKILTPEITIYDRYIGSSIIKKYKDSPINIIKGETDIRLTMPKLESSKSYLAEINLLSSGEMIAAKQYFRWVIVGQGATIFSIKTDKDNYSSQEKINVIINYIGPPDLNTIKDCNIKVSIYDQNKSILHEEIKKVDIGPSPEDLLLSIPVKKDVYDLTIKATILKDGVILDEYKTIIRPISPEAKDMAKKQSINNIILYSLSSITILIIILAYFFIIRPKYNKK